MPFPWVVSLLLGLLALYVVKRTMLEKKLPGPLPPGPRPKPLLGNLTDLPPKGEQDWIHWLKHKELYGRYSTLHIRKSNLSRHYTLVIVDVLMTFLGPISSLTVLGQTIVIVNDMKTAVGLLNKRSAVYSSRPKMVFASEM
jgi:hypothetical protein